MQIETERLLLRPLNISDLYTTHKYSCDVESTKYMLFLPDRSIEETEQYLLHASEEWESDKQTVFKFAITLGGKHIGAVSIYLNPEKSEAELGWIIDRDYWGNGYTTEAVLAIKNYAINELHISKLIACCDCRNGASERVMQKIGMQAESLTGIRQYNDARGSSGEYIYSLTV